VLLTLLGRECGEVLLVVVGVCPYATWRIGFRVDEELVGGFWVETTDPARRERAHLVFHGAAALGWDAIAFGACCRAVRGDAVDALRGFGVEDGGFVAGWWLVGM
jgi:hypothetical protein